MERDRFEEEARRVRPRLVSEARRLLGDPDDADDAVQDAMLKLWFYRERLDGYSSFDAPAIVTVRRVCLNRLRSLRPHADISEAERTLDGEADGRDFQALMQAIDMLPGVEQAVLRMRHIDGMEIEEIASISSSTPGAVRTALSRARRGVRQLYTRIYD
ncbi:RNA polymerase sigma factor [Paramuribaculum intestinale]|uniref:RNA polymerase sigma factor n=1 Tax=Paramuribaculum intestinale TaxID=2094151 RepID=UPI0025AFA1CA|nr:sigma-70 family RNA polymerase sigma factor [Paramuribaculum intestinale]